MRPLDDVQSEILAAVAPLPSRAVPLADALGRVLAVPARSTEDVPPFANTAMDGYAIRSDDTAGATTDTPKRLAVVGDLPAGHAPTIPVGTGQAIRIMTGAPIPEGADAIVMVERTRRVGDDAVDVLAEPTPGDHIRAAGGDIQNGGLVFDAGTVLTPAHVGVLASLGW